VEFQTFANHKRKTAKLEREHIKAPVAQSKNREFKHARVKTLPAAQFAYGTS